MPTGALFTPAARRHAASLAKAIAPAAARIERGCRAVLKKHGYGPALRRAFLAISPAGFARMKSLDRFLEEVEYQGRRLAKHNLSPAEAKAVLGEMQAVLATVVGDRFGPSREQLHLGSVLALERAFYLVREAEAQALFAIYRAEAEAADGDDLLRRVAAVLTRSFGAGAGRIVAGLDLDRRARRPLLIRRGSPGESLIADGRMRRRFRSFWSYPLTDAAVVQLGFAASYPWLPRELTLLEIAAGRCRGALERATLHAEVRRLESEARHAEEEERRRIGRELHDETGQALMVLRLQLELMEREAGEPPARRLREARMLVERTVVELRRLIAALSPSVLERLGLAAALHHLVARFQKSYAARVRMIVRGSAGGFPRAVQEAIYRTAQESLQNISRHSQASTVNFSVISTDNIIRLRVADNGNGFSQADARSRPLSFGLEGMRQRAALLGGNLTVRAAPGKGTLVILELPRKAAMGKGNVENSCTVN